MKEPRTRQSTGQVTLMQVARHAGVAPITVSRVLNNPGTVRERTLLKVRQAIAETGYVPNLLAGALASSRSRLVSVILPMLTNPVFSDTFQAITETLSAAGYQVLLGVSGIHAEREEQLLEAILSRRPDGIILTGTLHTEASRERLRASNVPVVETWDLAPDPIDMLVGFSHEDIGQALATRLYAKGYRHFAFIGVDDPRGSRRGQAFLAGLAALGISAVPQVIRPAPASFGSGRLALRSLQEQGALRGVRRMVVCTSDTLAHGVLTEAAALGLTVPGELAVMGFGDMDFAAHTHPALSTVRIDGASMGRAAAQALLERLAGNSPEAPMRLDLGFTLIERASG